MNRNEVLTLGRWVQAACPQQKWDKHTPDVWTDMLGEYPAEDAMAAARALVVRQPFISLSDLVGEIKRIRGSRFQQVDAQQLDEMLGASADPDDVGGFLEAVRTERKLIGDGVAPERVATVAQVTSRRPIRELIAGLAEASSVEDAS